MRKIDYLLWGIVFILMIGCNSKVSEKSSQKEDNNQKNLDLTKTVNDSTSPSKNNQITEVLPNVDQRIIDLFEKAERLKIPQLYSFEDLINIDSINNRIPLSDETLILLNIDRIKKLEDDDYGEIIWNCFQIELSENFITLVYTIYDGAIGQNVLINYSYNFEFIDYEFITYEDYVEGYSSMKSLIKKGKIIKYLSNYEQPNDTLVFKIDTNGFIDGVSLKTNSTDAIGANNNEIVHESLKDFEALLNILETEKFKIRIDRLANGNYRYASWSIKQNMLEEPDLILTNGEYIREGTGGNHTYEFTNGVYTYCCSITPLRDSQVPPASLVVSKSNERILYQAAKIIK